MKATLWTILASTAFACASAPPPRVATPEPPAAVAQEPPAVVAQEPAPAPPAAEPAVVETPAAVAEEAKEAPPPQGLASASDCEKVLDHIDNLYFESLTSASFAAPNLHPGWHNSRVRACTKSVDAPTRDCILRAKDLRVAKGCGSHFFAETMTAYRVR